MTLFVYMYSLTEMDSTWPCVCSVTDHRILRIYDKKNICDALDYRLVCLVCYLLIFFFCSYHCVTSLWFITEHTHGNMKFIERVNVKLTQPVNFRDGLKRKCRTENTLLNTCPIQVQFLMQRFHAAVLWTASGIKTLFWTWLCFSWTCDGKIILII